MSSDPISQCLTGLIINPVVEEFAGFKGPFLILAQSIGLLVGAVFWGVGCDIWGRRWSFNLTLLITAVFALAAGGAPDAITLSALIATWNIGVGGNLPVDSAVFLEFMPATHQWLLTVLSIWWAVGQLVASLVSLIHTLKETAPLRSAYSSHGRSSRTSRARPQRTARAPRTWAGATCSGRSGRS